MPSLAGALPRVLRACNISAPVCEQRATDPVPLAPVAGPRSWLVAFLATIVVILGIVGSAIVPPTIS